MAETQRYTIRPFSKPARTDLKDAFRIYLSPAVLLLHKLKARDVCVLWKDALQKGSAIVWPAPEKLQDTVVQTSRLLQKTYNLSLGDKISLTKEENPISIVEIAILKEVAPDDVDDFNVGANERDNSHWEWFLEEPLERAEFLAPGMLFENLVRKGQRRSFRIKRLDDFTGRQPNLAHFQTTSKVRIIVNEGENLPSRHLKLSTAEIGGLDIQIHSINRVLEAINVQTRPYHWLSRPGGILLYGSPGTGKSTLLKMVARTGWGKVFHIDSSLLSTYVGETTAKIRKIFEEAKSHPKSIVMIDQLDLFGSKRDRQGGEPYHAGALKSELELLREESNKAQVLVIAATSRIDEIDNSLRRPDYFEFEIEIPIPNAIARTEIIKSIADVPLSQPNTLLENLGERTHGFTGSDLYALLRMAGWESLSRQGVDKELGRGTLTNGDDQVNERDPDGLSRTDHGLTLEDIDRALLSVRPTAMREVFLEVPKVRWTDIGGQEHVKQSLREAIEWGLKNPSRMRRLGIQPKKGLLLYGPPGCSKTLTAKALATESGLNFIAVKGAELLNMYVGESERALREVFSKARAANPSIIFFDEIDAIASSRNGSNQTGGLNVLTTLLNEMDGIEPLRGVTVLAATNKPEVLDLALLRPGRLDTILYVGLPDLEARREILQIKTCEMDVAEDVRIDDLAEEMDGYTGAEIVSICDTAGYRAFRECETNGREEQITAKNFHDALSTVERQITPALRTAYEQWAVGGGIKKL